MSEAKKVYSALSLDTSIFKECGLKLKTGLLAALSQFKDGSVKVVLSDIVYRELLSHLDEKERETKNKVRSGLDDAFNYLIDFDKDEILSILGMDTNKQGMSAIILDSFIKEIGIQIVNSKDFCDISELINMYFSSSAPFEKSGAKKSEFPDAIILLSLEAWAKKNNETILVVSRDKGWKDFAKNKDVIHVIDNLGEAIEIIHKQNNNKHILDFTNEIKSNLLDHNSEIYKEIFDFICISQVVPDISAPSSYQYHIDDCDVEIDSVEIDTDKDNQPKVYLVNCDSNSAVLSIGCNINCIVTVDFTFFVWDSFDKEEIPIGSTEEIVEQSYSTDIVVYLNGNFRNGLNDMEINHMEIRDVLYYIEIDEVFLHLL